MFTYTFSRRQMDELSAALQILIDGDLLDENEKELAKRLIGKFKKAKIGEYRLSSGEPYAQVYILEKEEGLLENVRESLWQR